MPFGKKYLIDKPLILSDFKTFSKIRNTPKIFTRIVAYPIPATPKGGINPYPKINSGFNIIFKKKFKIKIFLYVTVSPSACNNEFKDTRLKETSKRNEEIP